MTGTLTIGVLAKRAECRVEAIRYYEREGLLPAPARSGSNYRLYDRAHLERLAFIRRCRSLDLTLSEIRTLLRHSDAPAADCGTVNTLIDQHIHQVAERIAELRRLERQLRRLRKQCLKTGQSGDCAILDELSRGRAQDHRTEAA